MNYFFWNKGLSSCPGFMTVENPRVCVDNWFLIGNFPSHVSLPFWYPILGLPNTYQSHMLHVWYCIFTYIGEIFRANVCKYSIHGAYGNTNVLVASLLGIDLTVMPFNTWQMVKMQMREPDVAGVILLAFPVWWDGYTVGADLGPKRPLQYWGHIGVPKRFGDFLVHHFGHFGDPFW
jgi:hypothetical protein